MPTPQQAQQKYLRVPFSVGGRGEIAFVTDPSVLARQEIEACTLTLKGERLMRPTIGSPFSEAQFMPIPSLELEFLSAQVLQSLQEQCSLSRVTFARLSVGTDPGTLEVEVGFVPIAFPTTLTVTVQLFTTVTQ